MPATAGWGRAVVRNASAFGDDCYQGGVADPADPGESEDCLFLNVWRPTVAATHVSEGASNTAGEPLAIAPKLPVMVWIYGGGFLGGSASGRWTNGANLAAKVGRWLVALGLGALLAGPLTYPLLGTGTQDLIAVVTVHVVCSW